MRMQILKPAAPDTPYVVLTTWESREAFENWVGSEDFKAAHGNPMPKEAFSGEGRLEQFDVVISAEKA